MTHAISISDVTSNGYRADGRTVVMLPSMMHKRRDASSLPTPPLEDPNFDRTVIFILEHHEEGAIGVVINRPSIESARRATRSVDRTPVGTVIGVQRRARSKPNALIALASTNDVARVDDDGSIICRRSSGTIASADLTVGSCARRRRDVSRGPRCSAATPAGVPGQLEGEIAAGARGSSSTHETR